MDAVDHHAVIGDALGILIQGLTPFVERVFTDVLPPNMEWTELLRRKDMASGRRVGVYQGRDLSLMLRAMTERIGELGFPFSQHLPRQGQNYASELREVRNKWAHNEEFSAADAYRAIDTVELLLRAVGADPLAAQVARAEAGAWIETRRRSGRRARSGRHPRARRHRRSSAADFRSARRSPEHRDLCCHRPELRDGALPHPGHRPHHRRQHRRRSTGLSSRSTSSAPRALTVDRARSTSTSPRTGRLSCETSTRCSTRLRCWPSTNNSPG